MVIASRSPNSSRQCWPRSSMAIVHSQRRGRGWTRTRRDERRMQLLTLKEAAAFLRVHPNTMRSYAVRGVVPASKFRREWRFLDDDLVAAIRAGYPGSARMQLSADDKEAEPWHSGNVQAFTTSSSQHLTERALDDLLARPTGRRPRNITTS
ncbi:helix-turn-helix domain-containing protein [Sphingomonas suaedae]|uniref:Helix-turn-helix domain-containing protein n=1 Tax=Sphingomonas suaedae TaxID=2599297 RepID=A0A518RCT7_9SPHN|nr:helix-turn-helix domain-containing protein [Sphingomonas suaedae]